MSLMSKEQNNDRSQSKRGSNFWTTVPGILTGLAGLVTALGTLIATLNKAGLLAFNPDKENVASKSSQNVVMDADKSDTNELDADDDVLDLALSPSRSFVEFGEIKEGESKVEWIEFTNSS